MTPSDLEPSDFAPGDREKVAFDWGEFSLSVIRTADDPKLPEGYDALWKEFSPAGEMEPRTTIESRLRRGEQGTPTLRAVRYEMMLVHFRGQLAAVRDHTVVVPKGNGEFSGMVHLSHNLVFPEWRRSGLAAWMRAFPVASARRMVARLNPDPPSGIRPEIASGPLVLLAEMEAPNPSMESTIVRLKAYEKAGYLKVDPARIGYLQPDFRPFSEIESSEVVPVPMQILLRIVGRETDSSISCDLLLALLQTLYDMYELEMRPHHIAVARRCMEDLRVTPTPVSLLKPTA